MSADTRERGIMTDTRRDEMVDALREARRLAKGMMSRDRDGAPSIQCHMLK